MPNSPPYSTQTEQFVDPLSSAALLPHVTEALRVCQSLLALSRSPLANSPIVAPALVKDDLSPTAEERGAALRLALRWAVEKIAPAPPSNPWGVARPFDDPTWRDPRWWRYNILRHRYLEPLHPDEFLAGGRFTETLLGLTGISSADAFYDERNRAINEVVEWLRRQTTDAAPRDELQQLALREALAPLAKLPPASQLLAIAATFDDVFPRAHLRDLAARAGIPNADAALDRLIALRFLLTGDGGANLWLAPPLRAHLYARQPAAELQHWHRLIAAYDAAQGQLFSAVRHYQRGGQDARAVQLLRSAVDILTQETPPGALIELIHALNLRRLESGDRYAVHLLLADLLARTGQPEAALAACRQALQAAQAPVEQARAYRRIGKLYESRNQQHALRYYQQAIERFPADAPELAEALKDRGWLHFLRQDWPHAEADLLGALEVAPAAARSLHGAIYDAMANLYRKSGDHARAVSNAELALALREEDGDLLGVAKSHGNLGLLYRASGDYAHAIAAYSEAMTTYARLGHQELVAVALLNIGAAHFLAGDVTEAVRRYQASLEISRALGLPLLEIKAHYNLAEAYAVRDSAAAHTHWELGYHLCRQHAFDDQAQDFIVLRATLALPPSATAATPPPDALDREEVAVLELARRQQKLTAQQLVEALHVSRATATRRLAALVEKGLLQMEGKGRGVHYRLVRAASAMNTPAPGVPMRAAAVEDALRELLPALRQEYAVAAVGALSAANVLRLVVRFQSLPDLARFFALERRLAETLGVAVDLVPEPWQGNQPVRWL